MFDVRERIL